MKQIRSQSKMQEVQPIVQEMQKKYKNDPQKAQMEMMKIYKENNVSPLSGCLPLLIQMPILFALYGVFMNINVQGASFLWIPNLYAKDPFYILPILSAATTYLSSYLTTKTTANTSQPGGMNMGSMNIGMSLMMGFMALNFRSALVLYWIMGNLIQLVQTYFLVIRPANKKKALAS
jgi:YidC/Oxa1 family membrane protein insertase